MPLDHLKDLYFEQLRDLYDAEGQIIDALPDMIEGSTSKELREALDEHLEVTHAQRERLEEIFRRHDEDASGETCEGMRGLLEEGAELLETKGDPDVKDAGIIAAAQRVEHYEIAGYGTARAFAEQLGAEFGADLLGRSLEEEEGADATLTRIAEDDVNRKAGARARARR